MGTYIVTGGNGFVGAALARTLRDRGDSVVVLDIADTCVVEGVEYRQVDITDKAAVLEACAGGETIMHVASVVHTKQSKKDFVWGVNLGGTENLIEAAHAHDIHRFVYVSSGSVVYEGKDIENGDESLPYPTSSLAPYADSKVAAEKLILKTNGENGLATCSLRPHVIFGPGDTRFLPAVVSKAKSGLLRAQVGKGTWLSDYTYVGNVVDAVILADDKLKAEGLDCVAAGEAYFITNGEPMPFWDFVRKVVNRLGFPPIKYTVPKSLMYFIASIKEGIDNLKGGTLNTEDGLTRFAINYMCTHHYFSIEKARRDLGYNPAVSVAEGIEITCKHLEDIGVV